jgi:hypothetical protein
MNSEHIYEEKIFAKLTGGLLGAMAVLMLIIMAYLFLVESIDDDPFLFPMFIIMFLVFLLLALNSGILSIKIDYQKITVGFGVFKKRIPWENIEESSIDETSAIKYGGAGIRTARVNGEWVQVFNVVGGPRVVLKLKVGRYKKFVFSTKNPEEVINVINGQLVLTK